jgi:signal transduction histidine kinase
MKKIFDDALCGIPDSGGIIPAASQTAGADGAVRGAAGGWFDTTGIPARWHCGRWPEPLGWVHIASDLLTFLAYMAIPLALLVVVRQRRDIPFPKLFWLFIAFIGACGAVHLLEAVMFWWPAYGLSGAAKAATAGVSWATVLVLAPSLPRILRLPSLEAVNEELRAETAQRAASQRELATANAELDQRRREIEHYLFGISHDLKSPVFTAVAMTGFLERDLQAGRTDRSAYCIEQIKQSCETMRNAIDDLLEVSRVGRLEPSLEAVDARGAIEAALRDVDAQARDGGAQIRVDAAPGLLVRADARLLHKALVNLLTNAIKYGGGPGGGAHVEISAHATQDGAQDGVLFAVRDEGPGVPTAHAEAIFDPFRRLTADGEGSGMGLAIVRRAAERMGGEARLDPDNPRGARFLLVLPRHTMGQT